LPTSQKVSGWKNIIICQIEASPRHACELVFISFAFKMKRKSDQHENKRRLSRYIWTSLKALHLNGDKLLKMTRTRTERMTLVLLLDMHKCQSDYNAGPQCVYRFVTCFAARVPVPNHTHSHSWPLRGAKKGQLGECCDALTGVLNGYSVIHSLTRCLHAHRARGRRAQWAADRN